MKKTARMTFALVIVFMVIGCGEPRIIAPDNTTREWKESHGELKPLDLVLQWISRKLGNTYILENPSQYSLRIILPKQYYPHSENTEKILDCIIYSYKLKVVPNGNKNYKLILMGDDEFYKRYEVNYPSRHHFSH